MAKISAATVESAYQTGIRHAIMAAIHPAPWRRTPPQENRVVVLDQPGSTTEEVETTGDLLFDRQAYDALVNAPEE